MAKLYVSVAVLFFFFAFSPSVARIQIRKPKYDVIIRQLSNPLPGSDVKASIPLPVQSNKVENHPAEHWPELDGKVVWPEKNDQKIRPIQKLPDPNSQKVQPGKNIQKSRLIFKLPDSYGQKARPVEHQAVNKKPVNKENKKPVEHLPDLNRQVALPAQQRAISIVIKNQTGLPIEPRPEESKPAKEAQPDSNEEKIKPIEDRAELNTEEVQPEPNDEEARPVEAMPLKQVGFRPFNRQFRLRSRLPYRICRHSHLHHIEENIPGRSQFEIPYVDGMMISFPENGDFDQEAFHGSFNYLPPKLFPFLHDHRPHHLRQPDVNVEKTSKHLFENNHEKLPIRSPENAHRTVIRARSKPISFLHRHGPHHLHQHDVTEQNVKDSNRLTENNDGVTPIPPKRVPYQQDLNEKKVPHSLPENDHQKPRNPRNHRGDDEKKPEKKRQRNEKKESTLRKRIRKFLGHYFD